MRKWIYVSVALIAILINILSFKNGHSWGGDYAAYVKQSQAFANGNFDQLRENIAKTDFILNYPWGYPILISPVIDQFDNHLNIIKIYTYLYFILTLLFILLLFKSESDLALLTILIMITNPYFWEFKNHLLADFPNLCFTYTSLFLVNFIVIRKNKLFNDYLSNFILGLSVFLAYVIRNQSFILIPSLLIFQLILYKKDLLKFPLLLKALIPHFTFLLLAFVFSLIIPIKSTSYLNQYHSSIIFIFETIWKNIFYYREVWNELFSDIIIISNFTEIFSGIFLLVMFIGLITNFKNQIFLAIFLILNMLLFLVTPFYQGIRYIMPIVPLFIYFFLKGLSYIIVNLKFKYGGYIFNSVALIIVILSFFSIIELSWDNYKSPKTIIGPYEKESTEIFLYIKNNTDKKDLIGFWKPRVMLLYSERNSIVPLSVKKCINKKVNYLVLYALANKDQPPLDSIAKYHNIFKEVFVNKKFTIYKLDQLDKQAIK